MLNTPEIMCMLLPKLLEVLEANGPESINESINQSEFFQDEKK